MKLPAFVSEQFVGRVDELALLNERLEDARDGRRAIVVIGGETGIGKSRLLREFIARADGRYGKFAEGHCVEHLKVPFLPIAEIVRTLRGEDSFDESLFPRGPVRTEDSGAEAQLHRVNAIAAALATPKSGKPNIIAIEDLHWADAATLGLVEHLASSASGGGMLTIVTVRSEAAERRSLIARALSRLRRVGTSTMIELSPLGRGEIAALVKKRARLNFSATPRNDRARKDTIRGKSAFRRGALARGFFGLAHSAAHAGLRDDPRYGPRKTLRTQRIRPAHFGLRGSRGAFFLTLVWLQG